VGESLSEGGYPMMNKDGLRKELQDKKCDVGVWLIIGTFLAWAVTNAWALLPGAVCYLFWRNFRKN